MSDNLDLNKIPKIRNRDDKRKLEKILRSQGKSKEEIDNIITLTKELNKITDVNNLPKFKECLLEGDKVKLHIEKIKSHPDWEGYQQEYKDFVESNNDIIFTVEYDKKHKNKPNLVCLKEDTSRQKWLFWDGNLLVLDEKDNKFKELYMVVEEGENE